MQWMQWLSGRKLTFLLMPLLGLLGNAPSARAQDLNEVLANTYKTDPALSAARSSLLATAELLPQAQAGYLPTLVARGTEGRTQLKQSTTDANAVGNIAQALNKRMTDRSLELDLTLNLYQGCQTMAATSSAEARVGAAMAQFHATEQQSLLNATTAYAAVGLYRSLLLMADQSTRELQQLMDWANEMYAHHQITITYVADIEAQLASANANSAAVRSELRTAESQFLSTTGMKPDNIKQWPKLPSPPASKEEAIAMAINNNPSIQQAKYTAQASGDEVRRQKGTLLPSLDFYTTLKRDWNKARFTGAQDYREYAHEDTVSVGVNVTVPIFNGGLYQGQIRQAERVSVQQSRLLSDTRRTVLQDVDTEWNALQLAKAQKVSSAIMLKAASISYEGYKRQLKNGSSTMQDVITAHAQYISAETALEQAEHDIFVNTARLLAAMGMFNAQQLDLPVPMITTENVISGTQDRWFSTDIE